MHASPPFSVLKRVPPGAWTAVTWCAMAIWPIVEFVWFPPEHGYSNKYPADGLDSFPAQALLGLAFVLAVAGGVLLRRRPVTGYVLLIAGTVVSAVAWRQPELPSAQFLAVDVALCFIAATRARRVSVAAASMAAGMLAGFLAVRLLWSEENGIASEPFMVLTVVIAWLVGNSARQARLHAERLRAQAAAQAVTAERLRIARELHDMVAHSIGIIALQAGAARRVIDTQPAGAREALGSIEEAGRETLAELRRMLGALRHAEAGEAPLEPAPGLADVDRLAATTTAAGVHVDVRWRGEPRPLPPEIDVSAYRIVQEAVANVLRHAGARRCQVTIEHGAGELAVEILDEGNAAGGRGAGASGPGKSGSGGVVGNGYGLVGIRERVGLLGGELAAGPRPGGGFRVAARLPVPPAPTAPAASLGTAGTVGMSAPTALAGTAAPAAPAGTAAPVAPADPAASPTPADSADRAEWVGGGG
ncbi:sensor histidine kinase [Actinomadura rugatobispora]|uniref:histidine kinase n=1 Tax=Actinomadura rugatobispora TaxID=1994 RepID=A0ABW1ABI5_9ACTN|nr:hypothetical protein GCM10010200_032370 [Actinomadura rugatobispora]